MDLLAILWYVIWNISQKQVPLFYDLEKIAQNARMFGFPELKYVFYFTAIIYLSPIISGVLLLLEKKAGLTISYIQTPFRLILIISPSIFFILWPLKTFFEIPPVWLGISLVICSEIIKVTTLKKYWSLQKFT